MRRGLLAWNQAETPKAALEARVQRVQAAMKKEGLDALLAYTNFPRPAAVSYLTHFIPYWNQGLMVMGQEGLPSLVVALSNRVRGWALETCHVDDVVTTPHIGAGAAKIAQGYGRPIKRVGVVDASRLPNGLAKPFRDALGGIELEDATELYASARTPADAPEIALTRKAAAIADAAIAALRAAKPTRASQAIAAIEGTARDRAAEEVQIALAPDLSKSVEFERFEGDADLGAAYAVRALIAYKGFWVRRIVTLATGETPAAWNEAETNLRVALQALGTGEELAHIMKDFHNWSVVGAYGGHPLADLADEKGAYRRIGPGSVISLAVEADTTAGPWLRGGSVLLAAAHSAPAEVLFG